MTISMQGSKQFSGMILEHIPAGVAIYSAENLYLLEANTLYMEMLDAFLAEEWRGGNALGKSMHEWGEIARKFGVIDLFQHIIQNNYDSHSQEFYLRNQQQQATYWNSTIRTTLNPEGQVTHLVHMINDVSEQVLVREKNEKDRRELYEAHQVVEAERKRLEIIEATARSVRGTLDTKRVGEVALKAINEQLNSMGTSIHIVENSLSRLRLLCADIAFDQKIVGQNVPSFEKFSLDGTSLLNKSLLEQGEPLVIEDIQLAARQGKVSAAHPLVQKNARGYISIPLYFNNHLEGVLSALFSRPIKTNGVELLTLKGCGTHIASALAHARLHAIVNHERERLRTTLDQVPEGILITEIATGGFSYANQAAADILGIPLEQLLEVPLHQHRWHRSAYSSTTSDGQPILPWNFVVVRALCGENLRSRETLIVQPSGEYVATLASSSPLYGENGLMTSSVIVLQDITAQKSLEQHKNDFLSIANHELRTPITVIQGFAEVLQLKSAQDNSLDSLTRQALASITEQSEHITGLIETMLDISRIEQDHFILHPEHCNLYTIIARAVDTHAITTRDHDIQIKLEGISPEQYLAAYVDRERISQSIHNLLSNAIKYSPSGGHVEVGLRYQPERTHEVQIWVKDQGLGISTDAQPHIFKRFYRANNLDPSISGFGIGLYLVKEIIVRHGGHIWVESSKNHGATFQITLPLNHLTDTTA